MRSAKGLARWSTGKEVNLLGLKSSLVQEAG